MSRPDYLSNANITNICVMVGEAIGTDAPPVSYVIEFAHTVFAELAEGRYFLNVLNNSWPSLEEFNARVAKLAAQRAHTSIRDIQLFEDRFRDVVVPGSLPTNPLVDSGALSGDSNIYTKTKKGQFLLEPNLTVDAITRKIKTLNQNTFGEYMDTRHAADLKVRQDATDIIPGISLANGYPLFDA